MKRYIVFSGYTYYPAGGWGDFKGSYDTIEEARKCATKQKSDDWWQIVDATTSRIVETD